MRGDGERRSAVEQLFRVHVKRLGMNQEEALAELPTTFTRPEEPNLQLTLVF